MIIQTQLQGSQMPLETYMVDFKVFLVNEYSQTLYRKYNMNN